MSAKNSDLGMNAFETDLRRRRIRACSIGFPVAEGGHNV